jgi:acetyl esterase/lipase
MWLTRAAPAVDVEGDIIGGVRGEWLRPQPPGTHIRAVVLYLHGGGYCVGTPKQYRALTSHLACAARIPCFAPAYRLAPEHPFPAALDDAVAVYQALSAKNRVVLAGDSAGGGLAIATAIIARERKLNAPSALVLFAPWVDLTLSRIANDGTDPFFSPKWLAHCARAYAGRDAAVPLVSPLFADLSALPPVLIQVGEQDLLRIDASRLRDALMTVSANVTLHTMPASWHLFQLHAGVLSRATAAVSRAGDFIADAIRAQNAQTSQT